jgi:hypothetical protein
MPTIRLTARAVAGIKAPDPFGKNAFWWDESLRGFGV